MLQYHHCVAFGFGFRMIKFKKPIEIGSLKLEENAFLKFQLCIFFMKLPNAKKTEFKIKLNGRMCLDVLGSNVKTFFYSSMSVKPSLDCQ